VAAKTIKTTRNNQLMAFVTLEDLYGTIEVIIFPRDYESYKDWLNEDEKLYVGGRVTVGEDEQSKLVCEKIIPFNQVPEALWLQFDNHSKYQELEHKLYSLFKQYEGDEQIYIYLSEEKAIKQLKTIYSITIGHGVLVELRSLLGKENVKVRKKQVEKIFKMH
jgi:DNA polymerase-3 subunit alpha